MKFTPKPKPQRLVYDVETYATGFADPAWVPQVVTCIAWKWYGQEDVQVRTSLDYAGRTVPMPHLDPGAIKVMLADFIYAYLQADAVITYNGTRFDQPILNGMMWYIGGRPLPPIDVYDLHKFGSTKGMKKGLDNVAVQLDVAAEKQTMNHAEWQAAYLEPGWPTIKSRATSDVLLTEAVHDAVQEKGWLAPAERWYP